MTSMIAIDIVSGNGLSPDKFITRTSSDIILIDPLETNLSDIWTENRSTKCI